MGFCIAVVVRRKLANWVIRSGSFDSLDVMSLVRKVFMHMKHLGSRFEAVHASMVSGCESSLHVVLATGIAPSGDIRRSLACEARLGRVFLSCLD